MKELWNCLEQILQQSNPSLRHVVPHYSKTRNNRKHVSNYGKVICGRHASGIYSVLALMLSTFHLSIDDRIESLHLSLFSYCEQENKLYQTLTRQCFCAEFCRIAKDNMSYLKCIQKVISKIFYVKQIGSLYSWT